MLFMSLDNYMIPCLSKRILGMDCLGCGFQRAGLYLFQGEFLAAFKMYPAIYPIFLLGGFMLFDMFLRIKYAETIKIVLVIFSLVVILLNYFNNNIF